MKKEKLRIKIKEKIELLPNHSFRFPLFSSAPQSKADQFYLWLLSVPKSKHLLSGIERLLQLC